MKYSIDGKLLKSWQFNVTYLGFGILARNGKVYCSAVNEKAGQIIPDNLIEVFDTTGNLLSEIKVRLSNETGTIDVRDVGIDAKGNIYIVDPESGTIRVFDKNNNFLTKFGHKGNGANDFSWINGIAIAANQIGITDRTSVHILSLP